MTHSYKKIIIGILALIVLGLGALGAYTLLTVTKKTAVEQTVNNGQDAEARGDTEQALAEYKKAAEQCSVNDDRCRNDMQMKISLMTDALKNEQSGKTGEPVKGAEKIPFEDTAPKDGDLEEKK